MNCALAGTTLGTIQVRRAATLRQQFSPLASSLMVNEFYVNCALCNTQQSYSPQGEGTAAALFRLLDAHPSIAD
jgi:hypothetical protein